MSIKQKFLKFKKATAKVVHDYHVKRYSEYLDDWNSSAQELEMNLRKRGLEPPCQLYYEYKFPDNQKNFEFDESTNLWRVFIAAYVNFFKSFTRDNMKTYLMNWVDSPDISDLSAFFGFCICLALSDIKDIQSCFEKTYASCVKQMEFTAKQIWQLNPELQFIKDYNNIDFVNGAIYGFAPKEIDFFIKLQQRRKTRPLNYELQGKDEEVNHVHENGRKITFFTLEHTGYLLAPETGDKIVKAIQEYLEKNPRAENIDKQAKRIVKKIYASFSR